MSISQEGLVATRPCQSLLLLLFLLPPLSCSCCSCSFYCCLSPAPAASCSCCSCSFCCLLLVQRFPSDPTTTEQWRYSQTKTHLNQTVITGIFLINGISLYVCILYSFEIMSISWMEFIFLGTKRVIIHLNSLFTYLSQELTKTYVAIPEKGWRNFAWHYFVYDLST